MSEGSRLLEGLHPLILVKGFEEALKQLLRRPGPNLSETDWNRLEHLY